MNAAIIVGLFPEALKPCAPPPFTSVHRCSPERKTNRLVARIVSKIPSQVRQTMEFIGPLVEERYAKMEELGESWDNPPVRRLVSF